MVTVIQRFFGIFIFTTLLLFFWVSSAHALTLTPVKSELAGDPGQTIRGEVEVYNEQNELKTFYVSYENFEPSGEDGSPKFIGGGTGLATWIVSETQVTLAPGEKEIIPYTITIPNEAEAGGYFGAVFFGGQNPDIKNGGEVSVGGKLGTLILLSVRGDIPEAAGLSDFGTGDGKRVYTQLPIGFSYRVTNGGADRIVPVGDVQITNTFGLTSVSIPLNENGGSVLPGSARRFQFAWSGVGAADSFIGTVEQQWNDLHIGWYTAHIRVVWGAEDTQAVARYDFFMFPWQLVLVIAGVLVFALVILRKYNSWIVSRAQKGS